jgi:hypothetical protein
MISAERLSSINSNYRWYISASPFPTETSIARAADFLEIENDDYTNPFDWDHILHTIYGKALHSIFSEHLTYRYFSKFFFLIHIFLILFFF